MSVPTVPQPVTGFEQFETVLVKEAIGNAVSIYAEEIIRAITVIQEIEKAQQLASECWAFTTRVTMYLLGTQENILKLWGQLRQSPSLFEVVARSAMKFRGMYSADDWEQLVERQSNGLSVFYQISQLATDTPLAQNVVSAKEVNAVLTNHPWVMFLLLLNYAPMTAMPPMIVTQLNSKRVAQRPTGGEQ